MPSLTSPDVSSVLVLSFLYIYIYFLYSRLWFICLKLPILYCDLTWLYRRYEWVTTNEYTSTEQDTQTWTWENTYRKQQQYKKCKENILNLNCSVKILYKIKLCCKSLMQVSFFIQHDACCVFFTSSVGIWWTNETVQLWSAPACFSQLRREICFIIS